MVVPTQVRENIVNQAILLFLKNGVNNVRVEDILQQVGCTKFSFYKFFDNKEHLLLTCLEHYNSAWLDFIFNQLGGKAINSPQEYVAAFLDTFKTNIESGAFKGSLVLSVLFQTKGNERVRQVVSRAHQDVQNSIAERLQRFNLDNHEARAQMLLIVLQGLSISASRGQLTYFDATAMALRVLVQEPVATPKLEPIPKDLEWLIESPDDLTDHSSASPRVRLINAADYLFGRFGSSQIGVTELISQANTARSTLYDQFGSKEELTKLFMSAREVEIYRILDWLIQQDTMTVESRLVLLFSLLKTYYSRPDRFGSVYMTELFQHRNDSVVRQLSLAGVEGYKAKLFELIQQDKIAAADQNFGGAVFHYFQGVLVEMVIGNFEAFDSAANAIVTILQSLKGQAETGAPHAKANAKLELKANAKVTETNVAKVAVVPEVAEAKGSNAVPGNDNLSV